VGNPNNREDETEAANESDMERDNCSEVSEPLEVWTVRATPNVPGLIQPIRQSKEKVTTALLMVNIMDTRRNNGIKTK
jgi:hypothetical protein